MKVLPSHPAFRVLVDYGGITNKMEPESIQLTVEQEDSLVNFQAITEEYDIDTCISFLSRGDWDTIAASNVYLSQGRDYYRSPPAMYSQEQRPREQLPLESQSPASPSGLSHPIMSAMNSVYSLARKFISGPTSTSLSFINQIRSTAPLPPPIENSSYEEILNSAQQRNRPLLVFIISGSTTTRYILEVISSEMTLIYSEYYLLWGTSEPNEAVQESLGYSALPCVGVFCVQAQGPVLLEKLEGDLDPESYSEFLDRNNRQFSLMQQPELQPLDPVLAQERELRAMQRQEFEEAEQEMRAVHKQQEERAALERQEALDFERKIERVGAEPAAGPDSVQLSIRLPSGQKVDRRFLRTAPIWLVHEFVSTLKVGADFELMTPFPQTVFSDLTRTLEELGLFPRAVVHVRTLSNHIK